MFSPWSVACEMELDYKGVQFFVNDIHGLILQCTLADIICDGGDFLLMISSHNCVVLLMIKGN